MPDTIIDLRKARSGGDVLNVTFRFLRQNAVLLGKCLLLIVGPVMFLSVLVSTLSGYTTSYLEMISNPEAAASFYTEEIVYGIIASGILGIVGSVLAVTATYGYLLLYERHGPSGFKVWDVWSIVSSEFLRILGVMVLLWLALFLPVLVVIIPCLGWIAYAVWVVYAGVIFSMVVPMVMIEEIGVSQAFQRCRVLVKGDFWATLGVVFVAALVMYLLSMIFYLPMVLAGVFSGMSGVGVDGGTMSRIGVFLANLVTAAGGAILYPLPLVAAGFQYFSLVEQKEHTGLMERVDALDAATSMPHRREEETTAGDDAGEVIDDAYPDEHRWAPPRADEDDERDA